MSKSNAVFLIVVLLAVGYYFYRKMPKYDDGEKAPDFTAQQLDGSSMTLSKLEGQYVLLDFWGSWCPPCRKENPALSALYAKHKDNTFKTASGFTIVSVAIETNKGAWVRAIERDGLTWPHHISSITRFKDPIATQYGVKEIPTKYLINPAGNIIGVNQPVAEIDAFLTEQLK